MDNYEHAHPDSHPEADQFADQLAEQLDQMLPPGSDALPADPSQDPLLNAAAWLASAPAPTLSPEALARIQAKILPDFPVQPVQPDQPAPPEAAPPNIIRPSFSIPLAAAAAVLVVLVLVGLLLTSRGSDDQNSNVIVANATDTPTDIQTMTVEPTTDVPAVDIPVTVEPTAVEPTSVEPTPVEPTNTADAVVTTDALAATDTPVVPPIATEPVVTEALVVTEQPPVVTEAPPVTSAPDLLDPTLEPTQGDNPNTVLATPGPPTLQSMPAAVILEGPIERIEGNVLEIYGIEVRLQPDDLLLKVLRVDDFVRIEGDIASDDTTFVVIAQTLILQNDEPVENEIYVQPGQPGQQGSPEIWRDPGDCSNPPPPWAPAHGWRSRCEGGGNRGGGNQGNQGNPGGGNQGNPGGGNQGNPGGGNQGNPGGGNPGGGNQGGGNQGGGKGSGKGSDKGS